MKKRYVIVLAFLAVLVLPVAGYAYGQSKPPYTNQIYQVPYAINYAGESNTTISVFDDMDNKCYVATQYNHNAIAMSCVKRQA